MTRRRGLGPTHQEWIDLTYQRTCGLPECENPVKGDAATRTSTSDRCSPDAKCAMHLARFAKYGSFEIPDRINTCKGGCGTLLRRRPGAKTGRVPVWCPTCQRAGFNRRRQERRHAARDARLSEPLTCSDCSCKFFLTRLVPTPPSRCASCRKARDREVVKRWIASNPERYAELSRKWSRNRRATLLQVEREEYEHLEIFERDGWICQLCALPVDQGLIWPDRMSATLDHQIPLTLGGPDIRLNAQLAHYSCNSSKANRIDPAELERLWIELTAAREQQKLLALIA